MYPVKVPIFRWKTSGQCQIVCRPDALADVCAGLLIGGVSFARVGSVEHTDSDIHSFMVSVEVSPHDIKLKRKIDQIISPFRTAR